MSTKISLSPPPVGEEFWQHVNATRNDVRPLLQAGIPARLEEFSCGPWGRHQPPRIEGGEIVFAVGMGYRSNRHRHFQNLYTLEADPASSVALVEMRKGGDLYGAGVWHYLVGVDEGAPFVAHVPQTLDSLAEALDYLVPAAVRQARARGLMVLRQGDWFFIPVRSPHPRAEARPAGTPLDDDHVPDEMRVTPGGVIYVRGEVRHGEHRSVILPGWHKAVRNKAIRHGRLALGGSVD